MHIILQAKNMDLTPSIRAFVDEKLVSINKLLPPKEEALAEARVEVGKPSRHHSKGFVFYAEINLKIGRELFRATEEHLDLHTAIDEARDNIEKQLRKHKEARLSRRKRRDE